MIAVAFLRDVQVKTKEDEKIEKYRSLKDEITRLWDIEIVIGISVNANIQILLQMLQLSMSRKQRYWEQQEFRNFEVVTQILSTQEKETVGPLATVIRRQVQIYGNNDGLLTTTEV